jgi:hypothetical protein
MSWAQAVTGPLAGATCLWQDLDGLHVEPAPAEPPPASLVWGWHGPGLLVRLRLDGDTAYVAVHDPSARPAGPGVAEGNGPSRKSREEPGSSRPTLPWSAGDHRIAASRGRGPSAEAGGPGAAYEQIVVDGIAEGVGPITFVRPVSSPRPGVNPDDDTRD